MTTELSRGSATIYQFPVRGRFAAAAGLTDEHNVARFSPLATNTVLSSAWGTTTKPWKPNVRARTSPAVFAV
ncbi:MAG: DUF2735 domain-containing protein [Pseudolabrys sp.]